jgi:xanthine/uracil permease
MIAGLITPPIIFANYLALDATYQSYMISASLISSGILSMIQMSRIHLFKGYYLGCGILCVVGTSFGAYPPIYRMLFGQTTHRLNVTSSDTTSWLCNF